MSQNLNERVVYQCKLHWGIFLWPVFSLLGMMVPLWGLLWFTHSWAANLTAPLAQYGVNPTPSFPWGALFVPVIVGSLIVFPIVLLVYLKSEVVLTTDRLRFKTGWLSLGQTEILLRKIETITLWEPLVGRVVGYGTVAVTGTGGTVFPLRFLPKPEYFHSLLQSAVNGPQVDRPSQSIKEITQSLEDMHARYMPKG
jgi:hypothetical protein